MRSITLLSLLTIPLLTFSGCATEAVPIESDASITIENQADFTIYGFQLDYHESSSTTVYADSSAIAQNDKLSFDFIEDDDSIPFNDDYEFHVFVLLEEFEAYQLQDTFTFTIAKDHNYNLLLTGSTAEEASLTLVSDDE